MGGAVGYNLARFVSRQDSRKGIHAAMLPNAAFIRITVALIMLCWGAGDARAQQIADTEFKPPIARPTYKQGRGPVVMIDEGHNNFHTASGRYLPFADLLRRDGYAVIPNTAPFSKESLRRGKILVVANAKAGIMAQREPLGPRPTAHSPRRPLL